ncbi:putative UNC93-like protein MFSD11 [Hypsibius exemplaris]|uniref:UNC93-like protein MFSD11 n=1 Tax=Hypsibius exemplaris TaxID=2072580 RepID=A0A1W0WYK7_HYPEX|nr:putative UNC93-like protein MFSD11 [Hypsibius exemplaris]
MLVHFTAFYLIYLNIPSLSSTTPNDGLSFIGPNPYLALFCTVLLGVGDAIWTNQLMSYLGCAFPYDCVSAFAVYQFWTAITNSGSFGYSTRLELPYQLLILVITAVPAAAGFCLAEWGSSRNFQNF